MQAGREPRPPLVPQHHHALRTPHIQPPAQPLRLDVPPEGDWRTTGYQVAQTGTLGGRSGQSFPRADSRARLALSPTATCPLCALCQRAPAEPMGAYCRSCGAHVARFRTAS